MNEEEFLKEHPSLKGKEHYIDDFDIGEIPKDKVIMRDGSVEYIKKNKEPNTFSGRTLGYIKIGDKVFSQSDIHKTQLDKQKVKGVIEGVRDIKFATRGDIANWLQQELGLK